ncbi:MAG: fumarate hydratase [Nitrospirota bacterium]
MREVHISEITDAVKKLSIDANYNLGDDVLNAFKEGLRKEESHIGKTVFESLIKNAEIARNECVPMCQDTGSAIFFVDVGQDVHIKGGGLSEAINEGVRQGYREGYLRKSIRDPITGKNTGDNTPAFINYDIVAGDKIRIVILPKGGGSENMGRVTMLRPADGIEGIKRFVVQRCMEAGPNPCPPVIVGVGIGGTMEKVGVIARKALLREIGSKNKDPELTEIEKDLEKRINNLGIGPGGFGGRIYTLGVFVEKYPCHIAALPVAVDIGCSAIRHKEIVI